MLKWTGERWIISLSKDDGQKTYYEKNITNKKVRLAKEKDSKLTKEIFSFFPDAKLIDVKDDTDA